MNRKSLISFSLIALVIAFWVMPHKALALTITPIRYEISGNPGETLHEKMTVINESKKAQVYYVSFANFEAQGDSGSPAFVDPKDDIGTWISTEQASMNLGAGEQKTVPFTIHVPKDAEPGGHFGAIFWGTTGGTQPGEVSIGTKTGVLILLSVKGDVKEAAGLVDFQTHNNKHFYKELPVGFQYRFSNQGGDRVKPAGNVVIRHIVGILAKKVNANPYDGNVLPGTTRKFAPEWAKADSVEARDQFLARNEKYSFTREVKNEWHNFALGIFRAKLDLSYGNGGEQVQSKAVYFIVFPWELMVIIIAVLVLIFLILRTLIRRYNRAIIRRAEKHFKRQSVA